MLRLLLHICCGPCSIFPFQKLQEEGYEITGFFYNPNIHPEQEFMRRREAISDFVQRQNLKVVYFNYLPEDFFSRISPALQKPQRCFSCWELRLTKAALYAKGNHFDLFSTTLLISPYQDHERLREIGEKIAQKEGIEFMSRDFRGGFQDSQNTARELGLYRQKYCGCIYSQIEREEAVRSKGARCKV
jgi:predicted adenine nucleotide alpha hydrolase (AANH) superfamily ATPase